MWLNASSMKDASVTSLTIMFKVIHLFFTKFFLQASMIYLSPLERERCESKNQKKLNHRVNGAVKRKCLHFWKWNKCDLLVHCTLVPGGSLLIWERCKSARSEKGRLVSQKKTVFQVEWSHKYWSLCCYSDKESLYSLHGTVVRLVVEMDVF